MNRNDAQKIIREILALSMSTIFIYFSTKVVKSQSIVS